MTFDLAFLESLQRIRVPLLDTLMSVVTFLGTEIFFIIIFCVLFWCVDKKQAYKIGMTFFFAAYLTQIVKIFFRVPRPWMRSGRITPVEGAIGEAGGYSFPSAHTSGAASFYGALANAYKDVKYKAIACAVVLLVAFSRMYLGVHTPQDVVFGLALGVLCVLVVDLLWPKLENENVMMIVAAAAIAATIVATVIALRPRPAHEIELYADTLKTLGATFGFFVSWFVEQRFIGFEIYKESWRRAVAFVVGIAAVVALHLGTKQFFNSLFGLLIGSFMRYFTLVCFVIMLYPLILKLLASTPNKRLALDAKAALRPSGGADEPAPGSGGRGA